MVPKKDDSQIAREFGVCQSRQFLAIAVTLFLLLFFAMLYKRPDLFGELSRNTIFAAQMTIFAAFAGFSALNWRCPSCNKYLGADIGKRICRRCGTRLR
jgi:hypothetical protein